jgi:carboxyl-terminal processing protease
MADTSQRNRLMPLIVSVAIVVGIFIGFVASNLGADSRVRDMVLEMARNGATSNKITRTLSLIDDYYVDEVNTDSLVEALMPDLMSGLDPHSVYIPKSYMGMANETLDGEFDGIGVMFNMATDTVIVLNVIPGGPSYKAGIQNGDRIIKVGDSLVAGRNIPQDSIVKILRGKRGTEVMLSLQRQGIASLVPITVTRGIVPIKSVDAAFMLTEDVGFVRLSAFARNTHTEIIKAFKELREQGMTKLIFDLRNNSGGFLDQAILLTNEFLPEGRMIVYTEDRFGNRMEEFSDGKGLFGDMEIVVIIDEGSASSSEILAGAIQDNDRGTIVGRRSFGKGLVQAQLPFADGSAIRLTTARYFTPTGRSIQKPYTPGTDNYEYDIYNRFLHSEMFSADSIKFDESLKYTTPGGRTVYGGGGIMPDIFVPIDTTSSSKYFYEVTGRNILYRYTMEYADRHRERINSITTVQELNDFLDADRNLLTDFIAYAERNGVPPVQADIRQSEKLLIAQLRAYIGRNTSLEDAGFYSNIYPIDHNISEALKVLD